MLLSEKAVNKTFKSSIIIFILAGLLAFNSCSDDETATGPEDEEIEVAEVVIDPQNVTFEVGEQHNFSAFLISAEGDTVNEEFDVDWNWYSSDPDVFTVEAGGTAKGHSEGEAHCIVEASLDNNKVVAKLRFVGRDSAIVFVF